MSKKLVVAKGKSILHQVTRGIMKKLKSGDPIPESVSAEWLADHPDYVEDAPESDKAPVAAKKEAAKAPVTKLPAGPKSEEKFALDPRTLKRKNVAQLNVMVKEREPDGPTFETPEEAVAYLSQNFPQ